MSLEEVSRKLENPLTHLWSLTMQENFSINRSDAVDENRYSNNFFFQPFLPMPVRDRWMLTFRPVLPVVTNAPLSPGQFERGGRVTGLGDIQYVIRFGLPNAWSIGMGPTLTIDWEASSGNKVTLPIGFGITKTIRVGRVPMKIRFEPQYSVVRPDVFGTEWNFRFQLTPVIKNPLKRSSKSRSRS